MSPVSPRARKADTPSQRLADALRQATKQGISRRHIAIELIGDDVTEEKIRSKKAQITKWVNGAGIGSDNAIRLVEAFRAQGMILPDDYFLRRNDDESWQQQMARQFQEMRREQRAQREILEDMRKRLA